MSVSSVDEYPDVTVAHPRMLGPAVIRQVLVTPTGPDGAVPRS